MASAESGGICLGRRQGWLPSACKCCKDLQSSGHGLLQTKEKSVRALICQELLLQVCPALTLFPTPGITFLSSENKILAEAEIVLTLSKPYMNCFINVIILISRMSQETMRAEGDAPHYFLYSIPKLHTHPIYLCWRNIMKIPQLMVLSLCRVD